MKSKTQILHDVFQPTEECPLFVAINLSCGEEEIYRCMDTYAHQKADEVVKELKNIVIHLPLGQFEDGQTEAYNHAIQIIKKHFNLV